MGRSCSASLALTEVLKKNAPAVSPAKPFTLLGCDGSTTPAICRPPPKMYWSAVPLGQMPPPTVVDPVAQICPSADIRHCTRLAWRIVAGAENSRKPVPGVLGLGLAHAAPVTVAVATTAATVAHTTLRRQREKRIPSSLRKSKLSAPVPTRRAGGDGTARGFRS